MGFVFVFLSVFVDRMFVKCSGGYCLWYAKLREICG